MQVGRGMTVTMSDERYGVIFIAVTSHPSEKSKVGSRGAMCVSMWDKMGLYGYGNEPTQPMWDKMGLYGYGKEPIQSHVG